MQLMDSHIDAGQELSAKDRQAYYAAIVEYLYYGTVPKLTGAAKAVFVAIRPTLDNSRARAEAGRNGGSKQASKREANDQAKRKQSGSKQASKREANDQANEHQTSNETESKRASYQDSPSPSYSLSPQEGVQGEEAPTLDEVRAYFEANCLRGDPELFWATYEATGWVDGTGRRIVSWTAQALRWSRRQVGMDADRAAKGDPAPAPYPKADGTPTDEQIAAEIAAYEERYGEAL